MILPFPISWKSICELLIIRELVMFKESLVTPLEAAVSMEVMGIYGATAVDFVAPTACAPRGATAPLSAAAPPGANCVPV